MRNEVELKGYILGFLASKSFKIRPEDKPAMESIFKGAPDWMIDVLIFKEETPSEVFLVEPRSYLTWIDEGEKNE